MLLKTFNGKGSILAQGFNAINGVVKFSPGSAHMGKDLIFPLTVIGMSSQHFSRSAFGQSTGNDVSGNYERHHTFSL